MQKCECDLSDGRPSVWLISLFSDLQLPNQIIFSKIFYDQNILIIWSETVILLFHGISHYESKKNLVQNWTVYEAHFKSGLYNLSVRNKEMEKYCYDFLWTTYYMILCIS